VVMFLRMSASLSADLLNNQDEGNRTRLTIPASRRSVLRVGDAADRTGPRFIAAGGFLQSSAAANTGSLE
jgi:hypothetical protein